MARIPRLGSLLRCLAVFYISVLCHRDNQANDATTSGGSNSYSIPFPISWGAFSSQDKAFYFTALQPQVLGRISLTNGAVKNWDLPRPANYIIATPSGQIFVALIPTATDTNGLIFHLDSTQDDSTNMFPVPANPERLAISPDENVLLIYGANYIYSFSAVTGDQISRLGCDRIEHIFGGPVPNLFYAISQDVNPGSILRFNVPTNSGKIFGRATVPLNHGGDGYFIQMTTNVITASGMLLSSTSDATDLKLKANLAYVGIQSVVELPEKGLIGLLVPAQNQLVFFQPDFSAPFLTQTIPRNTRLLADIDNELYTVEVGTNTVINKRLRPAVSQTDNLLPSVLLTNMVMTNSVVLGNSFKFSAIASDPDGAIAKVSFAANGEIIAETTVQPYQFTWTPTNSGAFELSVTAYDNLGAAVSTNFTMFANQPPFVHLVTPTATDLLNSPLTLHIEAEAHDVDGNIDTVNFFYNATGADSQFLGRATGTNYTLDVANFIGSDGYLVAVATDNLGASTSDALRLNLIGVEGDDFRNPHLVSGPHVVAFGNNSRATKQLLETSRLILPRIQSVWWDWTATETGIAYISTEGSSFDTVIEVSDGGSRGGGIDGYNDDSSFAPSSQVKILGKAGQHYAIMVAGAQTNQSGDIVLHIDQKVLIPSTNPPPSNDMVAQAEFIESNDVTITTSNVGATPETGETTGTTNSLWWKWRAPSAGRLFITTEGSDFDTVMALYPEASSVNQLPALRRSDDMVGVSSEMSLGIASNSVYMISVGGFFGDQGTLKLHLKFTAEPENPPANDNFADRLKVTGDYLFLRCQNITATAEPGEPVLNTPSLGKSIWWEWTAPKSGRVRITSRARGGITSESFIDIPMAVYQGTNLSELILVKRGEHVRAYSDQKSVAEFWASEGEKYIILSSALVVISEEEQLIINQRIEAAEFSFVAPKVSSDSLSFELKSFHKNVYIESSTNLLNWIPFSQVTVEGTNSFLYPRPDSAVRFFRAFSFE